MGIPAKSTFCSVHFAASALNGFGMKKHGPSRCAASQVSGKISHEVPPATPARRILNEFSNLEPFSLFSLRKENKRKNNLSAAWFCCQI